MINPFTLKDIADTVMSLNQIHMRLSLRKPHSVLKGVWVSRVFRATKEPKPLSGPLSTRPLATRHQLHEHGLGNTTEMQTPPPPERTEPYVAKFNFNQGSDDGRLKIDF